MSLLPLAVAFVLHLNDLNVGKQCFAVGLWAQKIPELMGLFLCGVDKCQVTSAAITLPLWDKEMSFMCNM